MDQLYYLSLYYIKFGIQTLICVCVRYVRAHTRHRNVSKFHPENVIFAI